MSHESNSDVRRMREDAEREFRPTLKQINRERLTGFSVGQRVGVWAGGSAPMYFGTVVGYGRHPLSVRIQPAHGRTRETWRSDSLKSA